MFEIVFEIVFEIMFVKVFRVKRRVFGDKIQLIRWNDYGGIRLPIRD